MAAPVWTWVDDVGPPPASPPYSGLGTPYSLVSYTAHIEVDMSSYITEYAVGGSAAPFTEVVGGRSVKLTLADCENFTGQITDIATDAVNTPEAMPVFKASSSVFYINTGFSGYISGVDRDSSFQDYYWSIAVTGIYLTGAVPQTGHSVFCLEVPSAIRNKLVFFCGSYEQTPTHISFQFSGPDGGGNYVLETLAYWFDESSYDSSIHKLFPYKLQPSGNINPVDSYYYAAPIQGPSTGPTPQFPVILSDSEIYYLFTKYLYYGSIGFGKKLYVYGCQYLYVPTGADPNTYATPSISVTYYNAVGTNLGSESFNSAAGWTFAVSDGGTDLYLATNTSFTMSPPSGTIQFSPSQPPYLAAYISDVSSGADFLINNGILNGTAIPYQQIPVLSGGGTFLPGVFLKSVP